MKRLQVLVEVVGRPLKIPAASGRVGPWEGSGRSLDERTVLFLVCLLGGLNGRGFGVLIIELGANRRTRSQGGPAGSLLRSLTLPGP